MLSVPGIKLLASDYDGTLARGGKVDPAFAAQLQQAAKYPRIMAIVTGRPYGNLVQTLADNNMLGDGFPFALVCEERDIYLWESGQYRPYTEHNNRALVEELQLLPHTRALVSKLRTEWSSIVSAELGMEENLLIFDQSSSDVESERGYVELKFSSPQAARTAMSWLYARIQVVPELTVVRNGRLVSLRHKAFGKGAILDILRQRLQLQTHEVMAVGDSGNDISMLDGTFGFHAAAVGNADPEVKSAIEAHAGVLLNGHVSAGIQELLQICMWQTLPHDNKMVG